MTRRCTALFGLALLGTPAVSLAADQSVSVVACANAVEGAMGNRLREYRTVVLGVPKASRAPVGSVRYDKNGLPWIKTSAGTWRAYPPPESGCNEGPGFPCELLGQPPAEKDNDAMEGAAEFPARRGWLELREAPTSELLPPLLQSMRALQCKLENVCAALSASLGASGNGPVTVQSPGCVEERPPAFSACVPPKKGNVERAHAEELERLCTSMRETLVSRERELLKFLVAYDAAHRSLRQFLGLLETFTVDIRSTLLGPVWEAVRSFHALGRIPCFSTQCEQ